jgi:hypothetical protein
VPDPVRPPTQIEQEPGGFRSLARIATPLRRTGPIATPLRRSGPIANDESATSDGTTEADVDERLGTELAG